ncbi:deoxyribodipyrimidine photolyase [Streptomyces eurocidicus]|uniref:Deoxyribodipyrimidine photo-lyase n=1 Tax=Streptomyces eurocidicus TaxID=66423 RepID=A0A2N8NV24_STREU|nr:deoxyribodipyrimidine photo-lyase [Streptomyces eurocidicus]MBB5122472.1 deoxyribodipyrimidine photo-lyase [Streptomyces eurocidicus]MBF6052121.1 deoxyribodipyrimidine photo-lyase [Streptomyces eurocidicus]PNE32636.1 deoxyribodipyrimidine photolyase [Streptomyces eurocidicus]
MDAAIALFTADLRLSDNPVLRGAVRAGRRVVPLFVVDEGLAATGFAVPNRAAFLADCLADLDAGLRERGGRLVVRRGDVVEETCRVAAETGAGEVHLAGGVSGFALRREERLRAALEADGRGLRVHDAVITAVAPGAVLPAGRDHFAVFTPYFRRWSAEALRPVADAPRALRVPAAHSEPLPSAAALTGRPGTLSPALPEGGERAGRRRLDAWRRGGMAGYADRHDDLAGDATSRLSPYLHFGCLSPVELVTRARAGRGEGAEAFVRQLAWRDFHHQLLAARPDASWHDYRPRHDRWYEDAGELAAWRAGRTGYPVVDAAMRQLAHEGWMHNRARLLAAGFLAKTLYLDWRAGARHFLDLLVDGDVANNQLNWQWVAGTGSDTRPNRVLNPLTQARRYDPEGEYVRRWVPELRGVAGRAVHEPWRLPDRDRRGYPEPVVEPGDTAGRFRRGRGLV